MESLTRHLRDIIDVDLASTCRLAGVDTWRGPRADAVLGELERVAGILTRAIHAIPPPMSPEPASIIGDRRPGPWGS